jgi:hypothetical protein
MMDEMAEIGAAQRGERELRPIREEVARRRAPRDGHRSRT